MGEFHPHGAQNFFAYAVVACVVASNELVKVCIVEVSDFDKVICFVGFLDEVLDVFGSQVRVGDYDVLVCCKRFAEDGFVDCGDEFFLFRSANSTLDAKQVARVVSVDFDAVSWVLCDPGFGCGAFS